MKDLYNKKKVTNIRKMFLEITSISQIPYVYFFNKNFRRGKPNRYSASSPTCIKFQSRPERNVIHAAEESP